MDNMISGNKAMAVVYSGDGSYVINENDNMGFFVPDQGSNVWTDGMVITKKCKNTKLAHQFIDYFLNYDVAEQNTDYIGYDSAVKSVYEYFKNDEFFSLCTGIVISAHEHVKKPDEKVYRLLLDRYNLNAEECLFIDDDDSGKNYETANKIGIKGRRIMPNQAEDVKKLLLEFNVKI